MENYNLWKQIPHQLRESCKNFDTLWVKRQRHFSTLTVLQTLLKLVSGTKESYQSVLRTLEMPGKPPSASSFCDARKKVQPSYFSLVRDDLLEKWDELKVESSDWNGMCLYAIDATKLNIHAACEKEGFARAEHCHLPQGLATALLRIHDRMVCGLDFSKDMNERSGALRVLEPLGANALVLFDCGYLSYSLLATMKKNNTEGLFRVQPGTTFDAIMKFRDSDLTDVIVDLIPGRSTRKKSAKEVDFDLPTSCRVRLIKHFIEGEIHILVTTITRKDIPAQAFIDLYMKRWYIEEFYKVLKCVLDIESFHAKYADGIEQELHAATILWNLSRKIESFVPAAAFKKTITLPNYIALSN